MKMKNAKRFLIASIILIAVGILGLLIQSIILNFATYPESNISSSANFSKPQGMMGMMRGFNFRQQNIDLKNINFDEVKIAAEKYLISIDLKNAKVKEIMEFSNNFYIETIEEDTGFGAIELLLDKTNGGIYPEYGPNMMWNQKYGMHSKFGLYQNDNNMNIGDEKAINIANSYLTTTNNNEFAGDEAEKFYGYYTIDTVDKNGATVGMLSINGFTGQVWYHSWHGTFIEMKEYE